MKMRWQKWNPQVNDIRQVSAADIVISRTLRVMLMPFGVFRLGLVVEKFDPKPSDTEFFDIFKLVADRKQLITPYPV